LFYFLVAVVVVIRYLAERNIQCHNYLPVVKKFTSYLEIRATSPFTSHYSSSCRHGADARRIHRSD
ncbi:hypothetical protein ACUOFC_32830, partial [Escherichia sp. TWPC-MK]